MASQLAGAKNPEQMHRVIRGFDTQFQTLGRTDGKSATDLRNEIFTQFVDNVGQQEQARVAASQPAPAPQMGEITEVDIQRGERQQQAEARRQRIDAELRASSSAPVPQMESVDVLNIDHSTPVSSPRTPAQSEPAPQMGEIDPLTQAAMEHDFKEARQKEQAQARQERIMREGTARSIERDKQRAATMADGPAKEQLLRDIAAAEKSNTPPTPPTMEGIDVPHND